MIDAPGRAPQYAGSPGSFVLEVAGQDGDATPAAGARERFRGPPHHGARQAHSPRQGRCQLYRGHNRAAEIGRSDQLSVAGDHKVEIGGSDALHVGRERATSIGKDDRLGVAGKLLIDAGDEVTLTVGSASITLRKDGTVIIKGKEIVIEAAGDASIRAAGHLIIKGTKIVEN